MFQAANLFFFIDNNHDVKLSFDEALQYLQHRKSLLTFKMKEKLFSRMDRNSDGFISPDEFDDDLDMNVLTTLY
jgi:Ca2+-binding EF-hand superfamily protein